MSLRTAFRVGSGYITKGAKATRTASTVQRSPIQFSQAVKTENKVAKTSSESLVTRIKRRYQELKTIICGKQKPISTGPQIEPAVIKVENRGTELRHLPETDEFIDIDNARFHRKLFPSTMKRTYLPKDKTIIHVSNFEPPHGSIAATTSLSECITTDKIYQCAAVAIVDKKNNMQTLIHCFPGQTQSEVTGLIKHVTSKSNVANLDITIAPGTYDNYDNTVKGIKTALDEVASGCKIKFANFSKETPIFNRGLILQDGKLSCCLGEEIEKATNKVVNPKEYISYVYAPYNNDPPVKI